MCNNPYMLLSHYEILACGTALWKLLDLTVFAQGLLINSPFEWWSVSRADSTCHWWEREREREREREESWLDQRSYHSSVTIYRGSKPCLLLQRQSLSLSLLPSMAGWCHHTTPHHPTAPSILPCLQPPPLFFTSHTSLQPTATSSTV